MREALALIPYKAAEERHWDEAEEDDEEDRPTDDTLRLWTVKDRKRDESVICYHMTWDIDTYMFPKKIHNVHFKRNIIGMGNKDDSHFLFDSFVEVLSVQSGCDKMLFESRNECQRGQAANGRHETVDH